MTENNNYREFDKDIDREQHLQRGTDSIAMASGTSSVIVLIVMLLLSPLLTNAASNTKQQQTDQQPFEYVEARLLKLGEIKDEQVLPDRIVPALPTAPDEMIPLDTNENKPEPEQNTEKIENQADAISDDKLREVFDKARAFAEIQDDYVSEGHPDGVSGGDVTDPALASLGSTYGHKISRLITDRWIVPTLLSDAEISKLWVKIKINFDINMVITNVEFIRKSENAMFDDTVQNALDRVRKEIRTFPEPPEAIAPVIFGAGMIIKLNGADAPTD